MVVLVLGKFVRCCLGWRRGEEWRRGVLGVGKFSSSFFGGL